MTPLHQLVNQIAEFFRGGGDASWCSDLGSGNGAYGSTGMGVGVAAVDLHQHTISSVAGDLVYLNSVSSYFFFFAFTVR